MNNFQDLPIEIIYQIFSELSPEFILENIQYLSKLIYLYCQDDYYWKILSKDRFNKLPKLLYKSSSNTVEMNWKRFYKLNNQPRYLIIGSEIDESRIINLKNQLKSRGLVNIDHFNVFGFKSLPCLYRYDSILFFSYCGFRQSLIGDSLSDFVDKGGGVVVCAYANCGKGNRLEGKWLEGGYSPFQDGVTQRIFQLRIGSRFQESHPILKDIDTFSGGNLGSHSDAVIAENSQKIADWNNGRPLIAEIKNKNARIIGLNFYPPELLSSSSSLPDQQSTNNLTVVDLLLYNSILYVSNSNNNK